jgi:hypothetical protein
MASGIISGWASRQLTICVLLGLKVVCSADDIAFDQETNERNESNRWQVIRPSMKDVTRVFTSLIDTGKCALRVHQCFGGAASAIDRWWKQPTQSESLEEGASAFDQNL